MRMSATCRIRQVRWKKFPANRYRCPISKTNTKERTSFRFPRREIKNSRTSGEPRIRVSKRHSRKRVGKKKFGPADAFSRLHPRVVFARDFFLRPHVATDVNLAPINSAACARERGSALAFARSVRSRFKEPIEISC